MRRLLFVISALVLISCNNAHDSKKARTVVIKQQDLKNEEIKNYKMLEGMYYDTYFPKQSVDKVKEVLLEFCFNIEQKKPKGLDELYELSHEATEKINDLQDDFYLNGSELETVAREVIAIDFKFISNSYGFKADVEELISNREW